MSRRASHELASILGIGALLLIVAVFFDPIGSSPGTGFFNLGERGTRMLLGAIGTAMIVGAIGTAMIVGAFWRSIGSGARKQR